MSQDLSVSLAPSTFVQQGSGVKMGCRMTHEGSSKQWQIDDPVRMGAARTCEKGVFVGRKSGSAVEVAVGVLVRC